jgi:hypothetical protein
VDLFRDSGWEVRREPQVPGEADLVVKNGNREYVIELKRAPESRRDRVVPLLAEAILQAQAYAQKIPQARGLAIIASPHLSPAVVDQALEFHRNYAPDVAVGFFDDRGFRVFRAPGLESLNSPAPQIDQRRRAVLESQSYALFSDLGQWMLKEILAQHLEPRFLSAPRRKIRNASELALAAGVSQVSASRLVRQLEAEGFLDRYADQFELVSEPGAADVNWVYSTAPEGITAFTRGALALYCEVIRILPNAVFGYHSGMHVENFPHHFRFEEIPVVLASKHGIKIGSDAT